MFVALAEKFNFFILMSFTNFLIIFFLFFVHIRLFKLLYLFLLVLDYLFSLNFFLFRNLQNFINNFVAVAHINFRNLIALLNRASNYIKSIITLRFLLNFLLAVFADTVVTLKHKGRIIRGIHSLVAYRTLFKRNIAFH